MSQLQKSASFRSRIPIRKPKISQRRCCSPPPNISAELKDHISRRSQKLKRSETKRRYSSSSYSSSDESCVSERPIQIKYKDFNSKFEVLCTSTDAISLNGLLDSVSSCGTFSSPPSPVQYQNATTMRPPNTSESYESLDKYNTVLDKLRVTDTITNIGVKLPYPSKEDFYTQQNLKTNLSQRKVLNSKYKSDPNIKEKQKDDWHHLRNRNRTKKYNESQGQKLQNIINQQPTPLLPSQVEISQSALSSNSKIIQGYQEQHKQDSFIFAENNHEIYYNVNEGALFSSRAAFRDYIVDNGNSISNFSQNANRTFEPLCWNEDEKPGKTKGRDNNLNLKRQNNFELEMAISPTEHKKEEPYNMNESFFNRSFQFRSNFQQAQKYPKHYNDTTDFSNEMLGEKINLTSNNKNRNNQVLEQQIQAKPQKINQQFHRATDDNEINLFKNTKACGVQFLQQPFSHEKNSPPSNIKNVCNPAGNVIKNRYCNYARTQQNIETCTKNRNFTEIETKAAAMPKIHHAKINETKYMNSMQAQQPLMYEHTNDSIIANNIQTNNNYQSRQHFERCNQIDMTSMSTNTVLQENSIKKSHTELELEPLNIVGIPTTPYVPYVNTFGNKEINHSTCQQLTNQVKIPSKTEFSRPFSEPKRRPLPQLPFHDEDDAMCHIAGETTDLLKITFGDPHQVVSENAPFIYSSRLCDLTLNNIKEVIEDIQQIFPPKANSSYRSECELSGSYVSLECPSPPGPPICLPESRRDPQARLSNYLKTLYTDLALKEPIIPPWAIPVAPGALSPARLEPEIRLHAQSHAYNDFISIDQLLIPVHTKDGNFLEAPRRVLIECPSWTSRSSLSLRILHGWARESPWPARGTPIALVLFIPLAELKRSFANYLEKELILKGPLNPFANGFGGFAAAWNSLETLGPKLLIVLDGYDNQRGTPKRKGKQYPPDVHDLLDGKLFPEARVIITTSITNCIELLPLIQRHVTYEGLTWGRSASLLGGGQWGAAPSRLLDTVQECAALRKIVRTPLGCLAVAAIYEATAGDLPTDELDVIESVLNCIAPETSSANVSELGRLMLFCLKMKRPCITVSELRMYCSSPESNILGCLDKGLLLGKSARKKCELMYGPMCPELCEFLAGNYIASLSNRPGLLAAEITGLTIGDEIDADMLKVIKYAMGLLGPRAHVLLSKLTPLWLSPQTIFSLALAGGSSDDNLSSLCDILGISKHPPISPLESKPLWVQVRAAPTELMGWGMALKSPTCTLKNLELIYQLEKHHLIESRTAMEIFLESLEQNESVSTLRITSLIENEVKDSEISYLGSCVAKALIKPRLESFELILTLLEEDPPVLKLQPVVSALCRSIPRQTKLNCLQLDLGLSTSQLVQLCSVLDKCPNITRLSLPHLRCERGAVTALATLLAARPLCFLSIPSCWGARDDPPSSSGVSMGSGSGSSTGTCGLIKQGSLTGVPSPRAYPPGLFSSLPRGIYIPTANMGRSATLPRQPMEPLPDKRSCDSVVSKTWYPTPACDGGPHSSGTLHDLLLAAREPYSKLHGIDLSKAQLSLEDSMCLGETVRLSNTLHTLKLEGSSRLSEILPSVLGASESPCLQMLSIGSPRLNLEDSVIGMSARSLTSCTTLRLLSLDGWTFRIENPSTLSILRAFLSLTSIRELSLANCRLQIGIFKSDSRIINPFESRSVVVLKLSSAHVTLADSIVWKGPQLLPIISGFPCLRELDLSAPARSGLGSTTHSTPLIIDDKCLINFLQSLHTYFSLLNTLKICNWVIHFDDPTKTLKVLSKCIRNSPISHLKLDGISVLDRAKKIRIESQFFHCFISSLPLLRWMGISLSGKKEDQITAIGNAVLDLKGYEIDIKLSESTIEHAKLMAQAISLDGKFDIKVSTFGTSSGILIHAEKSGTKSLNRKNKD